MSAVRRLRSSVRGQITAAAAEEISGVVEQTSMYEKEMERRCVLLGVLKPRVTLRRIDQRQCKEEEVLNHQQIFSADQEEPQPPQIKEEPQEISLEARDEEDADSLDADWEISPYMMYGADASDQRQCKEEEVLNDRQIFSPDQEDPDEQQELSLEPKQEEYADSLDGDWEISPYMMYGDPSAVEEELAHSAMMAEPEARHESYVCGFCGKPHTCKSAYIKHVRTHTREKPFSCSRCKKRFPTRSSAIAHLSIHRGERPFIKYQTEIEYSQTSSVSARGRKHTREKPYLCGFCGMKSLLEKPMIRHMRKHRHEDVFSRRKRKNPFDSYSGEKPFCCRICGKAFVDKYLLEDHKSSHSLGKPLYCCVCRKRFANQLDLITHIKSHMGTVPCRKCGLKFESEDQVKAHRKLHKHTKPFHCPVCRQRFKTFKKFQPHVNKHFKTSKREKCFSCSMCWRRYISKASADKHIRTVHKSLSPAVHLSGESVEDNP